MKIAVIGATGMLGKPVTRALIHSGLEVTIIARHPEKAKTLFADTKIIQADLKDFKSLEKALTGQEAIYLNLSIEQKQKPGDFCTETEGIQNIITACKTTGVRRIAYLSSMVMRYQDMNSFDWWVFRRKQEAVKLIKSSGLDYTIFYPSTFMETIDQTATKQGNRLNMAGISLYKLWFISGEDYGKQVAKSFEILKSGENRDYDIQGPESYTMDAGLQIFADNYAREKLKIIKTPIGLVKFLANFSQQIHYLYHILEAINKYPETFTSSSTWLELGKPATTLADYAKKVSG
jgi:uncharacterized protein YbjT (DUF2867 family)